MIVFQICNRGKGQVASRATSRTAVDAKIAAKSRISLLRIWIEFVTGDSDIIYHIMAAHIPAATDAKQWSAE